ncbi:MAG: helix-turn-helix domain-containing protein [Vicinamibacterales bacterium]
MPNDVFARILYYRLGVVPIRVPALRERPDDVPELVSHVLHDYCVRNNVKPVRIAPAVVQALARYHWPGNVRELRNVVERMAILCRGDLIEVDALPAEIRTGQVTRTAALHDVRAAAERERIAAALEQADWNVARAARVLGIERTHLHKRLRALGMSRP